MIKNMIAPYTVPVFAELGRRPDVDLLVLYETEIETDRHWRREELSFSHVVLPSVSIDPGRLATSGFVHLSHGVARELRHFGADVVIASGGGAWASPANLAALRGRRSGRWAFVPWWGSFRRSRMGWPRATLEPWVRRFVRAGDGWLAYGSRARDDLVRLGADRGRVFVAPNTARPAPAAPSRRSSKRIARLLYVGQLIERKGVDQLIGVLRGAGDGLLGLDEVCFAGDGELRPQVEALAARDQRIRYLGRLDWAELHQAYAAADAVVVPSRYDPWGLVVNEALAHGCLVVASDAVGAVDDLVEDGRNGLVYPAGDAAALEAAIARLAGWSACDVESAARFGRARMRDWTVARAVDQIVACANSVPPPKELPR